MLELGLIGLRARDKFSTMVEIGLELDLLLRFGVVLGIGL
jgi:hypothetical protein